MYTDMYMCVYIYICILRISRCPARPMSAFPVFSRFSSVPNLVTSDNEHDIYIYIYMYRERCM